MADNHEDDFNDDQTAGGGKGLRAQLETALSENKTLKDRLGQLEQTSRARTISDALKSAGAPDKIAKFYPSDADATEKAISEWLVENADVFGIKLGEQSEDGEKPPTTELPDTSASAQAFAQMRKAQDSALPPPGSGVEDYVARMKAAPDEAALKAIYAELGMKPNYQS